MKQKLLAAILSLPLISSCVHTRTVEVKVPVPVKPVPCHVGKYPVDVEIEGTNDKCPEGYACLTIDSVIKIGLTKRDADRFYFDVLACPYVHVDETQDGALDHYLSSGTPLPVK